MSQISSPTGFFLFIFLIISKWKEDDGACDITWLQDHW